MAIYAIGDLHGCYSELQQLLAQIAFHPQRDRLWFVGDLISRGPDSLACLRFVRDLGDRAVAVLGNHEIRALTGLSGNATAEFNLYMGYFSDASDREELYDWLRTLPLVHRDRSLGFTMVHAGLHPDWSLDDAVERSDKLSVILSDRERCRAFLADDHPKPPLEEPPPDEEESWLHFALALLTRIRYCTRKGRLMTSKEVRESGLLEGSGEPPENSPFQAWHHHRPWQPGERVVYGHWAMAGLNLGPHAYGLDSGAVYGGHLTAMRLDHPEHPVFQVDTPPYIRF